MKRLLLVLPFLAFFNNVYAQTLIQLDEIHLHMKDSIDKENTSDFYRLYFKARRLEGKSLNPSENVDILTLRPKEATINISYQEVSAVNVQNSGKEKKTESFGTAAETISSYGLHWVAINTKNLKKTVKTLLKAGYGFAIENFYLPGEQEINAVAMYGYDNQLVVLVEREDKEANTFGIDHVQMIVENLEKSIRFYKDIFNAELLIKKDRSAVLSVKNQKIVLSEPEALGLVREQIRKIDKNSPNSLDCQLSFLYEEVEPAFYAVKGQGYEVAVEPETFYYLNKPANYIYSIIRTPDGAPLKIFQENGRLAARDAGSNISVGKKKTDQKAESISLLKR
ncbi:Catechol 2,3-dioxygenase [Pseudarcicella hirudinis]|uniref:Catechol 2,3-dioxygenase n=1 Tax=Pseudarcicella hirudinis TaxID=1079859 RepID=A0A1I5UYB1_9BACT|nr:VOC family protein [Pseudarcicella hirudinis]SFQ00314.1 Catechol 2,3-dioxygenase [Pseudarcicella hirudinis]